MAKKNNSIPEGLYLFWLVILSIAVTLLMLGIFPVK